MGPFKHLLIMVGCCVVSVVCFGGVEENKQNNGSDEERVLQNKAAFMKVLCLITADEPIPGARLPTCGCVEPNRLGHLLGFDKANHCQDMKDQDPHLEGKYFKLKE